jgi:hypothetical protein
MASQNQNRKRVIFAAVMTHGVGGVGAKKRGAEPFFFDLTAAGCGLGTLAGATILGLLAGCGSTPMGNPAAPIDVKDVGVGYQYSQAGAPLEREALLRVLHSGGADLESEVEAQRRLYRLTQTMAIAGGILIGVPFGLWSADEPDPMWFLAGVGAGTLAVAFPIAYRGDQRLHTAVTRHNAHHGAPGDSMLPLLRPRTGLLLRTGYSGAYLGVDERIEGVGDAGTLSFAGPGLGYDWSVGYSVLPGLALTGAVVAVTQVLPAVKSAGEAVDNDEPLWLHFTSVLGGLNYYPFDSYGFYVQALAGYGVESARRGDTKVQTGASGLALAGTLGWDWSMAAPGAIGAFIRGLYAPLSGQTQINTLGDDAVPFTNTWTGVAVGLSVTYY